MYVNQIWQAALEDLRAKGRVDDRDYRSWLQPTRLVSLDKDAGLAVVGAPDTFTVEHLAKRYGDNVATSLGRILNRSIAVEFTVLNQAAGANGARGERPERSERPNGRSHGGGAQSGTPTARA